MFENPELVAKQDAFVAQLSAADREVFHNARCCGVSFGTAQVALTNHKRRAAKEAARRPATAKPTAPPSRPATRRTSLVAVEAGGGYVSLTPGELLMMKNAKAKSAPPATAKPSKVKTFQSQFAGRRGLFNLSATDVAKLPRHATECGGGAIAFG